VYALLCQTDAQGKFFPINDAQKGMSIRSRELISAVNTIYAYQGHQPELLSVAQQQGQVEMNYAGFVVAKDIYQKKARPFYQKSVELRDGKQGNEGALGILRSKKNQQEICVAFKYTAQGLGHGHYDKLSYSLYDSKGEVIQDYGAARWVNIDQKQGGRYLPENKTWAKQTIAHNTLVVNEASHFGGDFKTGNAHHAERYYFDASNPSIQIASAKDFQAYPGVEMHRTMVVFKDKAFEKPIVIDVFRVKSKNEHQYDLPLWFQGHLLNTNFTYQAQTTQRNILGANDGYQHLWKEAVGKTTTGQARLTWFGQGNFYTTTSAVSKNDHLIFARLGASDPLFNLRPDPCFIIRKKGQKNAVFASVIEPHGSYSPVNEVPLNPYGKIATMKVLHEQDDYTAIQFSTVSGEVWTFIIVNNNNSPNTQHTLMIEKKIIQWKGVYHLFKY
jgi:hypothetical protein